MRFVLLAAVLAAPLLQASPAAASPQVLLAQYSGEWRDGGRVHPGYRENYMRQERREMRRERRADRYAAFHHERMRFHFRQGGYRWARLPDLEKNLFIRDEWEKWGRHRFGR